VGDSAVLLLRPYSDSTSLFVLERWVTAFVLSMLKKRAVRRRFMRCQVLRCFSDVFDLTALTLAFWVFFGCLMNAALVWQGF
jgi:hypothetical protein